ncbi:MAG: group III truncated hemoglobin [Chitinophagales bacterium]
MKDIENIADVKVFVNEFYEKIKKDEVLAPIFALRIEGEAWEKHLNRMYNFWNTVLFCERTYKGNPFSKHLGLPVSEIHFSRWIFLFQESIDSLFSGAKAEETKKRASNMALMFGAKIAFFQQNPTSKPIM